MHLVCLYCAKVVTSLKDYKCNAKLLLGNNDLLKITLTTIILCELCNKAMVLHTQKTCQNLRASKSIVENDVIRVEKKTETESMHYEQPDQRMGFSRENRFRTNRPTVQWHAHNDPMKALKI